MFSEHRLVHRGFESWDSKDSAAKDNKLHAEKSLQNVEESAEVKQIKMQIEKRIKKEREESIVEDRFYRIPSDIQRKERTQELLSLFPRIQSRLRNILSKEELDSMRIDFNRENVVSIESGKAAGSVSMRFKRNGKLVGLEEIISWDVPVPVGGPKSMNISESLAKYISRGRMTDIFDGLPRDRVASAMESMVLRIEKGDAEERDPHWEDNWEDRFKKWAK